MTPREVLVWTLLVGAACLLVWLVFNFGCPPEMRCPD